MGNSISIIQTSKGPTLYLNTISPKTFLTKNVNIIKNVNLLMKLIILKKYVGNFPDYINNLDTSQIESLSVNEIFDINTKLLQGYMNQYGWYFPNETPPCKKRAYPKENKTFCQPKLQILALLICL